MKSHKVSKLLFQILCHLLLLSSAGSLQKYDKYHSFCLALFGCSALTAPSPQKKSTIKNFSEFFFGKGGGFCTQASRPVKVYIFT